MKLLVMGRQWLLDFAVVAVVYFLLAYVVLPALWKHHEHEPGLASLPMVTRTGTGIPGDPLNVGLVGSREDILHAMDAAGWFPASSPWGNAVLAGSVHHRRLRNQRPRRCHRLRPLCCPCRRLAAVRAGQQLPQA